MQLIDGFIARYIKEYDFYAEAGRLVAQSLESDLQAAGIRCIITHRAKSIDRLREKCIKRYPKKQYASVDDIYEDLADLAGVRVALYFPGERSQVDKIIAKLFDQIEPKKEFPEEAKEEDSPKKRFSGYSAAHYRVRLKEESLDESTKRYAEARVEIQVASMLMHAWSEVEHDLVYKPLNGDLSDDEYAVLDQLNGLVLAGEIALEQLQKFGSIRVASAEREFMNHYELAAHLLGNMRNSSDKPVTDSELGQVDLLFELLVRLELNTPARLANYLEALHENLEVRPLAEQVVDALIAENADRYRIYQSIRTQMRKPFTGERSDEHELYLQVGIFLTHWAELERLVHHILPVGDERRRQMPLNRVIGQLGLTTADETSELNFLRRVRNNLVHGVESPSAEDLMLANERLRSITDAIQNRYSDRHGAAPIG